ncbi:hypothetical protein UlMin_046163 [Ulmus minor]
MTAIYQPSKSCEIVANNEDLLIQILVKLPLKSLIKFKSVSKHWLSLISNPDFLNTFPRSVSGLFQPILSTVIRGYDFINLKESSTAPRPSLAFTKYPYGSKILHSCNGLMLCNGSVEKHGPKLDYVYNPTTKKQTVLPPRSFNRIILSLSLAFDPSKSPYYKVVCVSSRDDTNDDPCVIEIYSSETRTWRLSGDTFNARLYTEFEDGVFWNGAVHWISSSEPFLYMNMNEEKLRRMPSPPNVYELDEDGNEKWFRYFGESRGHLHLIYDVPGLQTSHLDVYEMEIDYSGWFVKFRVEFSPFLLGNGDFSFDRYSVVYIFRGDVDEESYAVIRIPGKVIRYNFNRKAFDQLPHIEARPRRFKDYGRLPWSSDTHEYIQSVALV